MILRRTLLVCSVVAIAVSICHGEENPQAKELPPSPRLNVPQLIAKFSLEENQDRTLFIYSLQELKAVYVWLDYGWVKAAKEEYPHDGKSYHLYRVARRLVPTAGQSLLVNSWTTDKTRTFQHRLTIRVAAGQPTTEVKLANVRSRDVYLVDKKRKAESDPYGFIALLNQYRYRAGLGPVYHDPGLAYDAHINNTMGSPHAYMGRARVQNWAAGYGSAGAVLNAWQTSPGHNRNLLDPSITRGGIAYTDGEWTFNGS